MDRNLILTRKEHQRVFLDVPSGVSGGITVAVVSLFGGRVSLGFEADKRIIINREEIQQRIDAERAVPVEASCEPLGLLDDVE